MSTTATEQKIRAVRHMEVKQVDVVGRTFEGLASTWDLDLGNDVIKRGAFKATLKEWRESGRVLPLLDSHNWFSVRDAVGRLIDAKETDDGLWTRWKIVPGSDGDEILARLRPDGEDGSPFIDSMSIGFVPQKWEIDQESGVRTLKEVDLHEVSLVLFPMNPEARIDTSTVKERVRQEVDALIGRVRPDMRAEVKSALREALESVPDESATKADPLQDPEPEPEQDPPEASDGAGEPEFHDIARLHTRRLAFRTTHRTGA